MKMNTQKKMSRDKRANLVAAIADCRKVLDLCVDVDELFYVRKAIQELQTELLTLLTRS
jgi:hypothetical protein